MSRKHVATFSVKTTRAPGWAATWAADLHFRLRAQGLRLFRWLADLSSPAAPLAAIQHYAQLKADWALASCAGAARHANHAGGWTQIAGASLTPLWTGVDGASAAPEGTEWQLTAGKIHNLRVAARRLDGLLIPAGQSFSFWRNLGAPTRGNGYVAGRELREGCVIASVGGGLCQLSNALYQAALAADCRITERHRHSKVIAGSAAARDLDATVFWNYVDLRFTAPRDLLLEVRLTADRLVVNLRGQQPQTAGAARLSPMHLVRMAKPARRQATGQTNAPAAEPDPHDCIDCSNSACVHYIAERSAQGKTLWLLDDHWPEFDAWRQSHHQSQDVTFATIDGQRFRWRRYGWTQLSRSALTQFPLVALRRSFEARHRRSPARRRAAELGADAALARAVAARIAPEVDHLVVPLSLLAPLAAQGVLGGRRLTVWINRPPLQWLHPQLDRAARELPQAGSLTDFRADAALVAAEQAALAHVTAAVTPHREIAQVLRTQYGMAVETIAWNAAPIAPASTATEFTAGPAILFPGPALARKGAYAVRAAARELDLRVLTVGTTMEADDFWDGLSREACSTSAALAQAQCVILPAYVEPQPRLLLAALARGIPVICSSACGLAGLPGVHLVPPGDAQALIAVLTPVLWPEAHAAAYLAARRVAA
jgi:hypothetical protein